jgi:membrane fusion protein (multidrug efflux system)
VQLRFHHPSLSGSLGSLLLSCGLGCLVACAPQSAAADTQEPETRGVQKRDILPVRTAVIEIREMLRTLETTSKLESEFEIQVFPRSGGVAVAIMVEEGDHVLANQTLAKLDDRDEVLAARDSEVALEEAKTTLELLKLSVEDAAEMRLSAGSAARQAERDYERDRRLVEEAEVASPVSEQALEGKLLARDQARHDEAQREIGLRRASAQVRAQENAIARASVACERAQLAVSYKEIRAPFEGVIAQRNIRAGDMVSAAAAVYVLTDVENLRAIFTRPQEELELFTHKKIGTNGDGGSETERLEITATAEAFSGHEFRGQVERISPTIEAASGQFRVTARISSNEQARLLPGMLMRMRIVTDRHPEAMVVPKRALRREGARRYVLKVEEDAEGASDEGSDLRILKRVNVAESFSDEDYVEILPIEEGALQRGDEVVFIGSRDLIEGQTVRIDPGAPSTDLEAFDTETQQEVDGLADDAASDVEKD